MKIPNRRRANRLIASLVLIVTMSVPCAFFAQNPFDIQSRLPDSDTSVQHTVSIDTALGASAASEDTGSLTQAAIERTAISNPFDVSHIPIRKSAVAEKAPRKPARSIVADKESVSAHRFIFWVLLFCILLLVGIVNIKRSSVLKLYRSVLNDNYLKLVQREENGGLSGYFMLLYLLFVLNAGLFIFLIFRESTFNQGLRTFALFALLVFGIYTIRHTSLYLLARTFPIEKVVNTYNFSILLFNGLIGVLLIPINAFLAYSPTDLFKPLIIIGLSLVLILLVIRLLRGLFLVFGSPDISYFHFFIYLCTCEIAPVFIVLKILGIYNPAL